MHKPVSVGIQGEGAKNLRNRQGEKLMSGLWESLWERVNLVKLRGLVGLVKEKERRGVRNQANIVRRSLHCVRDDPVRFKSG